MLYFVYRNILLLIMRSTILVGGQAVIEGVMMRVPGAYATAVRKKDGAIIIESHKFESIITNSYFLSFPIIRGMIHLYESMKIGYGTLQWSAEMNEPDDIKPNKGEKVLMHVNGFGGTPLMELYLLFETGQKFLEKKNIKVSRSIVGNYTTSLEMAGGAFTITKLDDKIVKHWDSPVHTSSLRWKM